MIIKLPLTFILMLCLTACVPTYSPPVSGPTAKLGAIKPKDGDANILLIFNDPITCDDVHLLNKQLYGAPTSIPANQLTTIIANHISAGSEPSEHVLSFYPKKNATYIVRVNSIIESHGYFSNQFYSQVELLNQTRSADGKLHYTPVRFIEREPGSNYGKCPDIELQKKLRSSHIQAFLIAN